MPPPTFTCPSNISIQLLLLFSCRMIYKCVMCDTVFTQKPLLYTHFDTHLAKQKVHVFKCPDCTKLYAQKGSMMEHIKVPVSIRGFLFGSFSRLSVLPVHCLLGWTWRQ